jgi:hypothetical protein
MTIYFCLIKYHQSNVIEVMLKKTSFLKKLLKKLLKNILRRMVVFLHELFQVIISLNYLSS